MELEIIPVLDDQEFINGSGKCLGYYELTGPFGLPPLGSPPPSPDH
jgi:hypothetical protein